MPDRLTDLIASTTFNGIDFVEIANPGQTRLVVHFLNQVPVQGTLTGTAPITIADGDTVPAVPVAPISPADWTVDDDGRPLLALATAYPGDFSTYTLTIASTVLDRYFAAIAFTFKAGCPSTLDCATPAITCEIPGGGPVIDYLAKDFTSFRAGLLDYSARTYPDWVERDEPDLGVMLAELLAAVGDDLSYTQDRIAGEATLPTATQRRSVMRHARLVDYEPTPATSARVLLQVDVTAGPLPSGAVVLATVPDGGTLAFETGAGLIDPATGAVDTTPLVVDPRWNRRDHGTNPPQDQIVPYLWDDSQRCLPAGATQIWVHGHGYGFPVGDPKLGTTGLAILIDTASVSPVDPPIRQVVHLTGADEKTDNLYKDPVTHLGIPVTRLTWDAAEALTADHDLTRTVLAGNLIPASEGRRHLESFVIDPPADSPQAARAAVVRTGPDQFCGNPSPLHLHTLQSGRLAWLTDDSGDTVPEVSLAQIDGATGDPAQSWRWRRRLLDAELFEAAFTIDPVRYSDLRADRAAGVPRWDYDGDDADSIRFGDGTFGERPATGSAFEVTYRVGNGAAGNVAAGTITGIDPSMTGVILSVSNPFPAAGGADAEPLERVRRAAPYAYRARQFRAVRREDYTAAAQELPWVLDAGTEQRWTGSWLTVFTTAQPTTGEDITLREHLELIQLLDRRRIAGYEVYTPPPRYVGLDLIVTVCARPDALQGEVAAAIGVQLGTGLRSDGRPAFFAPGQLRFGTPLERSDLDSAIQEATGVAGVLAIDYRRRGYLPHFTPMPETVTAGRDEILRVDNDPNRPDRGSLRIVVEGGK
ncbi:hypothetical protein FK531_14285 [Rhodococcus spelaei]|uniref:Uncharacterized protein n=1 Tax=Rhodococcus spelaei TaxID=2546320 RepID=A0A541B7G8_9NOCA|nr:baseplate J/gp47 family protein [Rhodococcus spelaei]TQF68272.1 hypothetical protein FK531_14285 [Rhodococcus spelaei]